MSFELVQQGDDASTLSGITAQVAQVDLQLGNQLIYRDQRQTGTCSAFLLIGDKVLTEYGNQ